MAKTRTLQVVIAGDASQLNRSFVKAGRDVDTLGKKADGMGKKFSAGMKVAGAAAAGALAVGLKQSVSAAIEAEKSQARLQAQLKASGISYQAHSKEIENAIQKTSKLAGLDDEDLQNAFSRIVRTTGSVNLGLKGMAVAADVARGKGVELSAAGETVAKALAGNKRALKEVGVELGDNASRTEILSALQGKYAGQAKAYGETTQGAADKAATGYENLQEIVGRRLTPALEKVANKFADLVEWMQKNKGTTKTLAIATGSLVVAITGLLITAKVAGAVMTLRKAMIAMNIAMSVNPLVLIAAAVAALGVALVIAYRKSETFRKIVDGAFSAVKKVAVGALRLIVKGLDALTRILQQGERPGRGRDARTSG